MSGSEQSLIYMERFDKHRLERKRKRATRRQCEYTVQTDSLLDTAQPRISRVKCQPEGASPGVSNGYLGDRDDISTHPQQGENHLIKATVDC